MLESKSFDVCKNATAPIIAMLGCSEIYIEVSSTVMETADSNDCKEILRDNRYTNGMLAITWERVRFSYKNRQKFINLFTQSISRLYQTSQLYPKTKEQEESSRVT